jgi:hypothetical protein
MRARSAGSFEISGGSRNMSIFADQCRFDDRRAVVHQRRHYTLRIEFEIFRVVLLALEQIDGDPPPMSVPS